MSERKVIKQFTGRYRFLSNFYPAAVVMDGAEYPSVEHAFQAAKTTDHRMRRRFAFTEVSPAKAKRMGRTVKLRFDWENIKVRTMYRLVRLKFECHPELRKLLRETGDALLEEGNWWGDLFWGVDEESREGQNHLGKILMKVRRDLANV